MATEWYFTQNGAPSGPVDSAELRRLASTGKLQSEDLVWKEGMAAWAKAGTLKGLFPSAQSAAPTSAGNSATSTLQFSLPSESKPAIPFVLPGEGLKVAATPMPLTVSTPTAVDFLAVGDGPAIPARSATNRNRWLIPIAVGAAVIACLVGTAIGALLLGKPNDPQTANPAQSLTSSPSESLQKELEAQRESLRAKIQDLEEQHDELEKSTRELEKRKEELTKDIQKLVGRREALLQWGQASFVLLNPSHLALGIVDKQQEGLHLLAKADGENASDAIAAARNGHIVRIDKAPELARNIYASVQPGTRIPEEMEQGIRKFWRVQRFAPPAPNEEPEFVAFRDLQTNQYCVGFFLGIEGDVLRYHSVAPWSDKPSEVNKVRIQTGSARKATADKILSALSDADLLNYCLLNIAQKLGSETARPDFVNVAVHTVVDIPETQLKHYEDLDKDVAAAMSNSVYSFMAIVSGTALREVLYERHMEPDLQKAQEYLQDEIYAKLTTLGIPVIDNEHADLLDGLRVADELNAECQKLHATHLVIAEVKRAESDGRYHLSMRLDDVNTGQILWAAVGDRVADATQVGRQYHLNTGRIALLQVNDAHAEGFVGQEDPPVVPALREERSKKARTTHLVYVEDQSAGTCQYRTLFGKDVREVPRDHVKEVKFVDEADKVPLGHLMRYHVCRIAANTMPAAGRALVVNKAVARVTLGKKDGIVEGDKLRVLRVNIEPARISSGDVGTPAFVDSQVLLPTELTVAEVYDNYSKVFVTDTGLEEWWPENSELKPNDLVIARARKNHVLAVAPPDLVAPIPQVAVKMSLNVPNVRQRLENEADETSKQLTQYLVRGIRKLNIPVIEMDKQARKPPAAATHLITGTITLSPKLKDAGNSAAARIYRIETSLKPVDSENILDHFEYDIDDRIAPAH